MVCATGPRVGGGRAKKVFFNLNLSITFSILDNFPNEKNQSKRSRQKTLAGGGPYEPLPPRHLVVKAEVR